MCVSRLLASLKLFVVSVALLASQLAFSQTDRLDLSDAGQADEIFLIQSETASTQEVKEAALKLSFSEDERIIQEKRDKLASIGKETLYKAIFKDLLRHHADPLSETQIEIPLGPRVDLSLLNPNLENASKIGKQKMLLQKSMTEKNIAALLSEFEKLNAEQLADFIVRKEAWLNTLAESLFKIQTKLHLGNRENPKTILRVNKFIRAINNAFYTAPLNVAYSNTFGFQLGLTGYAGLAPGTWTEDAIKKRIRFNFNATSIQEARKLVEDAALKAQQIIESKLKKDHAKPWIKFRQKDYGLYLSLSLGSAVTFRTVNGKSEINLEFYSESETYKTSKTPVVHGYADINGGIILEERRTGKERLFTYIRNFIPFVSIYSKGSNHMGVIGGVPLFPSIPAFLETKAARYYFFRLPLNQEAKETKGRAPFMTYLSNVKETAQAKLSCIRFFN